MLFDDKHAIADSSLANIFLFQRKYAEAVEQCKVSVMLGPEDVSAIQQNYEKALKGLNGD